MEYCENKQPAVRTINSGFNRKSPTIPFLDNRNTSPILQLKIGHDGKKYTKDRDRLGGFSAATQATVSTEQDEDIAHKLSFDDLQICILRALNGGNFTDLKSLASELDCSADALELEYRGGDIGPIVQKANVLLKAMNNSPKNLRPGSSTVNRGIQNRFDPSLEQHDTGIGMSPTSSTLYEHAEHPVRKKEGRVYSSSWEGGSSVGAESFSPTTKAKFFQPPK